MSLWITYFGFYVTFCKDVLVGMTMFFTGLFLFFVWWIENILLKEDDNEAT